MDHLVVFQSQDMCFVCLLKLETIQPCYQGQVDRPVWSKLRSCYTWVHTDEIVKELMIHYWYTYLEIDNNYNCKKNYFTSSDPHRYVILKHIRHKFWHSFCPSVSRFHQNYPLLLVPSPGSGSSSDRCDLSSQTDSNWLSLCLIQNNFRRLGAWKLRFERYKTIWLS